MIGGICVGLCAVLGVVSGFIAVMLFVEGMDRLAGYVVEAGGLLSVAGWAVAGLAWGIIAGSLAALRVAGLWRALVVSITLTLGGIALALGFASGIAYAGLPTPPRIDGRRIVLAYEIMVPARDARPPDGTADWRVLVESRRESHERRRARLDWAAARRQGDWLIVPGDAPMGNRGARVLTLYCQRYLSGSAREVPVAEEPGRADMAWSLWLPAPERVAREGLAHCGHPLRYRLRFADAPQ